MAFNLEPVARHRGRMVDAVQQELSALESSLAAATRLLGKHFQLRGTRLRELRGHQQRPDIEPLELRRRLEDLQRLERLIAAQHAAAEELRDAVEKKRLELTQRSQEQRVLQRLKERHLAQERQRERWREGRALDEVNATRHVRQHGAS